jgi:hypothetical protein
MAAILICTTRTSKSPHHHTWRRIFIGFMGALLSWLCLGTARTASATSVYASRLTLTWSDPNNNEIGIKIERANSPGGPWVQIAQLLPNATSYRDTGLAPNTAYYYRARAYNAAGNSAYSNVASNRTSVLSSASIVGWGLNDNNQATPPSGLSGVLAVESGTSHSLALKGDGTVVAWGLNTSGQATVPAGLTGVADIAGGGSHSLALKGDGTVVAWGLNASGQTTVPPGLSGVVDITAGTSHSLAIRSNGQVVTWGSNTARQTSLPMGMTGAVAISGGGSHSTALVVDCYYTLMSQSANVAVEGSSGSFEVTAPSGCAWSSSSSSGWLHPTSSGTGNGIINYTVDANLGAARSGTITVQGQSFTVNQVGICSYAINTSATPIAGGTVTGGGPVACDASVTLTASANPGYVFVNWTESGTVVSSSPSYTFAATASRTLVANFSLSTPLTYTISTSAAPAAGGSTSGGGSKSAGASVTVTASANAGYSFVNWTESGSVVSTAASYTFTANANRALVANFSPGTYTISPSPSPMAGGTTSGGGNLTAGSTVTVTAHANTGFNFVSWTEGGITVSTFSSYTFTASANRSLVANFSAVVAGGMPTVTNALIRTDSTAVVVAGETNVFDVVDPISVAGVLSGGAAPVYYTWNFGDGSGRTRSPVSSATHSYPATCGAYPASVTVDNGVTTATTELTVSVACQLTVTKLQAELNFAKANADRVSFAGIVDLAPDYDCAGKVLTVNLGGAQVSFALNRNGHGVNAQHHCRLRFHPLTGQWTIKGRLRHGSWRDEWGANGLVDVNTIQPGAEVKMTTVILLGQESFAGEKTLTYKSRQGASGVAK